MKQWTASTSREEYLTDTLHIMACGITY